MNDSIVPQKQCTKCGETFPETSEFFHKQKKGRNGLMASCKKCHRKNTYNWRKNNQEKYRKLQAGHHKRHQERLSQYNKEYNQTHREKRSIQTSRRRARKLSLPYTFTEQEWSNCLEYFNYACAVCRKQLRDLLGKIEPHADHWIPLSSPDCLGTVAKNIVCLCSYCNQTKHAKLPEQWLIEKYGKRKAREIIKRIEAYFARLE